VQLYFVQSFDSERRKCSQADMESDGQAQVGSVEVGLFDRKIVVNDAHIKRAGEVTIGRWEASGLSWPLSELIAGRTPFSGVKLGDPFQAGHLELHAKAPSFLVLSVIEIRKGLRIACGP